MKPFVNEPSTKTLFIAPWMICGGADRCVLDMAEALDSEFPNHECAIVTLREHSRGNPWISKMPKGTIHYDAGKNEFGATQIMMDVIQKFKPDRIIASNAHEFLEVLPSVRKSAPFADISFLVHMHLPGEWNFVPLLVKFQDSLDTIFTVSIKLGEDIKNAGARPELIKPLRWFGFRDDELKSVVSNDAVRRRCGIPDDEPFVLWPFRIEDQKRPELVFPVVGILKKRCQNLHHVIAGDGSRREWLQQVLEDNALDDRVHFIGPMGNDQMPHLIRASLCTATLSRDEGIPLTFFESLQLGKPVICTDVGAVAELIDPEVGCLIDNSKKDIEIVKIAASAIAELYFNEDFREITSKKCLEKSAFFTHECWRGDFIGRLTQPMIRGGRGYSPHVPPIKEKVFVIGAPKTGTSSVGAALKKLGFNDKGFDVTLQEYYHMNNHIPILEIVGGFDSFSDGPFNTGDFYKILAEKFPDAKFILTTRGQGDWAKSFQGHFAPDGGNVAIKPKFRMERFVMQPWLRWFHKRNSEIVEFFKGSGRLLVLNVSTENSTSMWTKLCKFLGIEDIPNCDFPKVNVTKWKD